MKRRAFILLCLLPALAHPAPWRLGAELGAQLPLRTPVFPVAEGIANGGLGFGLSTAVAFAGGRWFLGLQSGVLPLASVSSSAASVAWILPAMLFAELSAKAFFIRVGGGPSWLVLDQAGTATWSLGTVWELALGGRIALSTQFAIPITAKGQYHPGNAETVQGGPFFALGLFAGIEFRWGK